MKEKFSLGIRKDLWNKGSFKICQKVHKCSPSLHSNVEENYKWTFLHLHQFFFLHKSSLSFAWSATTSLMTRCIQYLQIEKDSLINILQLQQGVFQLVMPNAKLVGLVVMHAWRQARFQCSQMVYARIFRLVFKLDIMLIWHLKGLCSF